MQVWTPGSSCAIYEAIWCIRTDSVSSYITVYLLSISQKQEEGNVSRKAIGVNRARQVFMNRCAIFWDSCELEKDRMDMKEVVGKNSII